MPQLRQQWSEVNFLSDLLVWSPCCIKDSQESSQGPQSKSSIIWNSPFLTVHIAHLYMITGKIIALTLQTSVAKWGSAFNTLCMFFIAFLPSKEQVSFNFVAALKVLSVFEDQENKICHCFHFSLIYMPWCGGTGCHEYWVYFCEWFFECWVLSQFLHLLSSSRGSLILCFLPLGQCHLHICGC